MVGGKIQKEKDRATRRVRYTFMFYMIFKIDKLVTCIKYNLGSAELIFSHRQRVADVAPHSDDNNENPPYFGQGKTKFPQELHHILDEVAHSRPASCCIWKLGSYVIGSIDSLACTE